MISLSKFIEIVKPTDRVWVYTFSTKLSLKEKEEVIKKIQDFSRQWQSHGSQLDAQGYFIANACIAFVVNNQNGIASGCSIDASVKFLKELEADYKLDLFDRLKVGLINGDAIDFITADEIENLVNEGKLTISQKYLNTAIAEGIEIERLIQPLSNSWLAPSFKICP